jgi:cysteine desulfurase
VGGLIAPGRGHGTAGQTGGVRAYLDHAATTPMLPEAVEAMLPYLAGTFGNPSGSHADSRRARVAVDDARELIADLVGADLGEVVFTGSGTEADNLAVAGVMAAAVSAPGQVRPVLVCSAMEHHAVLTTARAVAARTGAELREVPSDADGLVELTALAEACTPEVRLVSVMSVNNEIGTRQPLEEVATLVRRQAPGAVLHTDAVQAAPWLDLTTITGLVDLTVVSAHKFGGPKGVGALVVRDGVLLEAVTHGGGQERERRSGTHNVAGIVATATALAITADRRAETTRRVRGLRDRLVDGLMAVVPDVAETGHRSATVPGIAHLRFDGVEGEALVLLLDEAGVSVSAGAACSSGAVEPSHVLAAMGLDAEAAQSGIRFSLGSTTTDADIDLALAVVPDMVAGLRN